MKREEINIRDPYILLDGDTYYLYGTRSATTWGPADGFDCYQSKDGMEWEGPFEIYHRPQDSPFDICYWAPECYKMDGKYYLLTTLGQTGKPKAIYVLASESPKGPFQMYSEGSLTPEDWNSIDGTFYFEDGKVYLIFSHSFEDVSSGDMCVCEISPDFRRSITQPELLFQAPQAPWAQPVPFAKEEFGMDGDVYFTDGPCPYRMKDGTLLIFWSSWSKAGYAVGIARSDNGRLDGNFEQLAQPLFPENGGHGMVFTDKDGKAYYLLHYPNDKFAERPVFYELKEEDRAVRLV